MSSFSADNRKVEVVEVKINSHKKKCGKVEVVEVIAKTFSFGKSVKVEVV